MTEDGWLDHFEDFSYEVGDLFGFQADAVLIPVNVGLNLNYTLGRALRSRGGEAFAHRLNDVAGGLPDGLLPLGGAVAIDTSDLAGLPKHVVLVAWWNEDTAYDYNHLYRCYAAGIRKANEVGSTSLVLPMLGGGGGVAPALRARAVCDVLRQFHRLKGSSSWPIRELVFADLAEAPVRAIEAELERRLWAD